MKVVIEQSDSTIDIMTEEEFEKIKDELDEFDGIHPYIFKGWLTDSRPVEAEVMPNEVVAGGQWQKCPKCDGQGIVSKPPYIAGDQNTWASAETSYICNLCNGQMVIKQ